MTITQQATLLVTQHARKEAACAGGTTFSRQGVALAVALVEDWYWSSTTAARNGGVVLDPEAQSKGGI